MTHIRKAIAKHMVGSLQASARAWNLVEVNMESIARLRERAKDAFNVRVHLRKNDSLWPPVHTPIVWQRTIPNRCAVMMHTVPGALQAPVPPVLSLVTGKTSYNDSKCRELLEQWIDHPQRLWDAVYET